MKKGIYESMLEVYESENLLQTLTSVETPLNKVELAILNSVLVPESNVINLSSRHNWHCLVDVNTFRIIFITTSLTTISALNDTLNSSSWLNFNIGTVLPRKFLTSQSWLYIHSKLHDSVILDYNNLTAEHIYRYKLLQEKAAIIDKINWDINYFRKGLSRELDLQDVIYQEKFRQAREIIRKKLQEDTRNVYPFVSQYADVTSISLQSAAKEIMFKHKTFMHKLSDTETLRIKYTNTVREENDIRMLSTIVNDFRKESRLYARM